LIQIVCKINQSIFSSDFISQHRKSEKDFTRKRSLTFPHLICFMLNMVNGSLQSELSRFFQVIEDVHIAKNFVTAAAFCKARKKFSFTAFTALNKILVTTFYDSSFVQTWNGLRLLAVDSSVVALPEKNGLFVHFGKPNTVSSHPTARLSQLYDINSKLSIDVQVCPHASAERDLALKHLEHAKAGDLVLYDRGYPATWLFISHQQKKVDFCARAALDYSNYVKNFMDSEDLDTLVTLPCIERSLKKCRKLELPTTPITVRLIRVDLENGDSEVLITSLLDHELYPHKLFEELYHQRWFIEEDYKLMKSRLEMENFSGLSVEAIEQDIHAMVLTKNIAAIAILEAEIIAKKKFEHRKRAYKINFSYALSQLKDNVVRFVLSMGSLDLMKLFISRIACVVNAVRPERSFKRKQDSMRSRRKRHSIAYKRVG